MATHPTPLTRVARRRPVERETVSASAEQRRNFVRGVVNGALFTTGMAFLGTTTVIPAYVNALSGSRLAVGLAAAILIAGWPLPQLFVARHMRRHAQPMLFYRIGGTLRCLFLLPVVFSPAFLAQDNPRMALVVFLAGLAGFSLAGGVGGLAFTEIVARTVPAGRRSTFFSQRLLWGSIGSLAVGWLVRQILSPSGALAFPYNYALVFAFAWLLIVTGIIVFMTVREPPLPPISESEPFWEYLSTGITLLWGDKGYRRYLSTLTLAQSHQMAVPFYAVFILKQAGAYGESLLGSLIVAQVIGGIASNLVWGRLGDRRGSRVVLSGSIAMTILVPACALLVGKAMGAHPASPDLKMVMLLGSLLFALLGVATAGSGVAGSTYLLDISPTVHRTTYVGFTNTLTSLYGLYPLLGGLVAEHWGTTGLFIVVLILQLAAMRSAVSLRKQGDGNAV